MKDSFRERLPKDLTNVLILKIIGIKTAGAGITYRRANMIICAAVIILLLFWSGFVASQNRSQHSVTHFLPWCFYYIILIIGLFPIFHGLALLSLRMAGAVDRMLTPRGLAAYERWAKLALLIPPQIVFGLIMGAAAPYALRVVQGVAGPDTSVLVLLPSYVIVAITGFFCGVAGYWAIVIAWFARLMTRRRNIQLYPFMPARTPGLEELSQITATGFVGAAVYSVLLLWPLIYWTYNFGEHVTHQARTVLLTVKLILMLICAAGALAIGLVPKIHISLAIQRVRRTTMLKYLRLLSGDRRAWYGEIGREWHDLYAMVAHSPGSTLGSGNVVQITVGVVVALIPLAVTVLLY